MAGQAERKRLFLAAWGRRCLSDYSCLLGGLNWEGGGLPNRKARALPLNSELTLTHIHRQTDRWTDMAHCVPSRPCSGDPEKLCATDSPRGTEGTALLPRATQGPHLRLLPLCAWLICLIPLGPHLVFFENPFPLGLPHSTPKINNIPV